MNKAILIGRLTRDPELRYTSSNRAVCQFTVAIDRPFTNQASGQREADFINVVAWDKTGENVGKYMTKGRLIAVEGRIQTRNYENNEGRKVYVTEVIASNVQFLESRNASQNTGNMGFDSIPEPPVEKTPYDFAEENPSSTKQPTMNVEDEKDPFASFGEQIEISDNDLPF
ncbi:MAG: single-stranded DNA-binding protein [Erysipelotrichaceae bacterium]|nr:single-stranded DNA-binding protein [Erysipelotrichaceae bacterium]